MIGTIRTRAFWLNAKLCAVIVLLFVFGIFPTTEVSASGSASLTLSAAQSSVANGGLLSVTIDVSLQEATNSVQIFLKYDPAKLQFLSINGTQSAFKSNGSSTEGGGTVEISRYNIQDSVEGKVKVATVNFKGLANSGSSTISFGQNTIIPTADGTANQWDGNTGGGTYTHAAATSDVQNNTQEQQAKIAAATPVDKPIPVTEDSSVSNVKTYIVAIIVKAKNGSVVEGAKVTLGGSTTETDSRGVAGFTGVPAGTYSVNIDADSFDKDTEISVGNEADPLEVQQFEVFQEDTSKQDTKTKLLILTSIVFGLLILALVLSFITKRKNIVSGPNKDAGEF